MKRGKTHGQAASHVLIFSSVVFKFIFSDMNRSNQQLAPLYVLCFDITKYVVCDTRTKMS